MSGTAWHVSTTVSPSPRELRAQLLSEELVAMDLILTDEGGEDNALMLDLVPDPRRRGYLRTLTAQLQALGDTLHDSVTLDYARTAWAEARRTTAERQAEQDRARAAVRDRERRWLEALPPEARRSVERHRRRQRRQR